jgi:tetratricopeptide (TPR) repeat protein
VISSTADQINETKTYYEVPSLRVSRFVERPELLKEIENSFVNTTESAPRPRRTVLLGMGGQGKTQLALEYCRLSRISETYQAIFWVDASSSNTVSRAFEAIAAKISYPGRVFNDIESKVAFVKGTLEGWQMPWLMVFDNYDNVDEFRNISDYLPEGRTGTILFTSRHASSERLGSTIRLTQMTEDGSLELLLRQSKCERTDENNAEGMKIVKRLGYLPLAIDQAGAYISQRKLPLSRFIKHYEDRKEYVLKNTPLLWEYRRKIDGDKEETLLSVFTTWELSFQQIHKSDDERILISHFLTLSAFLNASDVGEDIFKFSFTQGTERLDDECLEKEGLEDEHARSKHSKWTQLFTSDGAWDQYKYEDIITELSNLSLLQRVATESTVLHFSLHPLVADWLRLRTKLKRQKAFMMEGTTILANYIDKQDRDGLSLEVKQYLLAHIDACLYNDQEYLTNVERSNIESLRKSAVTFASYFTSLDRYIEAEALYKRALKGYEKALGPEHTLTLDTVHNLGFLCRKQGKLAEAEALYERALKGREKALGPEHTLTLDTVHYLGLLYFDQGKLAKAETLYQRALEGREKALGPEHKSTLNTVNNLGVLYSDQGKLAEAEALCQRALAGYEKMPGLEHKLTLDTVNNLGILFSNQGKLAEAEALYQRALAGKEKTLGPEHTVTLDTVDNLGLLFYNQGKLAEAEALYQRALAGREKMLGPEHKLTLDTVYNLGLLFYTQGKLAEAEAFYQRALVGYEKTLGPEHKPTLDTVYNLRILCKEYKEQGKLAEAEALFLALAEREKAQA